MPGNTYKMRGIILRKTKLGEKDLIVTMLDESGALVRAVAKGARKPGGSLAARMELFSPVDAVMARGRNLDVVTSATFSAGAGAALPGVEQAACASALAELLCALAQEDLPHARLFDMSCAAFQAMLAAEPGVALAVSASAQLKALAYAGFRPSFRRCVVCGDELEASRADATTLFSIAEGGVVCDACRSQVDAQMWETATLQWAEALMRMRFDDLLEQDADPGAVFSVLQLVSQWVRFHVGKRLKALDFLFSCGLF